MRHGDEAMQRYLLRMAEKYGSQRKAADAIGIDRTTYGRLMATGAGPVNVKLLRRLVKDHGMTAEELMEIMEVWDEV